MRLPHPLENGRIQVRQTDRGLVLTWKVADNISEWRQAIVFHSIWLMGWPLGYVPLILLILTNSDPIGQLDWFRLVCLAAWTFAGFHAGTYLVSLVRFSPISKLILSQNQIQCKEGVTWETKDRNNGNLVHLWMKRDRCSGTVGEIRNLQLQPIAERFRLSIDIKAERFEIGKTLEKLDKIWLHDILQQWLSSASNRNNGQAERLNTTHSNLEIRYFHGEQRIAWKDPNIPIFLRFLTIMFCLVQVMGTIVFYVNVMPMFFQDLSEVVLAWLSTIVVAIALVCYLSFFVLVLLVEMLSLYIAISGLGISKLRLNSHALVYQYSSAEIDKIEMDSNPDTIGKFIKLYWNKLQSRRRLLSSHDRLKIPKDRIRKITLDRIGEDLKLFIMVETETIEIAPLLSEPDKEKLYQILDSWWNRKARN